MVPRAMRRVPRDELTRWRDEPLANIIPTRAAVVAARTPAPRTRPGFARWRECFRPLVLDLHHPAELGTGTA